jgi:hypothetical protein
VVFDHVARNQHGEVVALVTRTTLMRCRPAGDAELDGGGRPGR